MLPSAITTKGGVLAVAGAEVSSLVATGGGALATTGGGSAGGGGAGDSKDGGSGGGGAGAATGAGAGAGAAIGWAEVIVRAVGTDANMKWPESAPASVKPLTVKLA